MADKKVMKVTRAVIEEDGKILAARRRDTMSFPLKWEFPGGKLEEGEDAIDCIRREIKEELDVDVHVVHSLRGRVFRREHKDMEVIPFVCTISKGNAKCIEHKELVWAEPENLARLDWTEADQAIYLDYIGHKGKTL